MRLANWPNIIPWKECFISLRCYRAIHNSPIYKRHPLLSPLYWVQRRQSCLLEYMVRTSEIGRRDKIHQKFFPSKLVQRQLLTRLLWVIASEVILLYVANKSTYIYEPWMNSIRHEYHRSYSKLALPYLQTYITCTNKCTLISNRRIFGSSPYEISFFNSKTEHYIMSICPC